MPIILYFSQGAVGPKGEAIPTGHGYFMAAVIFSLVSLPCFFICFKSVREVIGGGARKAEDKFSFGGQLKILGQSFKATFTERNTAILVIAMFFFLTGIFGRLGIMFYYFRYVLGNMMAIA